MQLCGFWQQVNIRAGKYAGGHDLTNEGKGREVGSDLKPFEQCIVPDSCLGGDEQKSIKVWRVELVPG